MSLSCNQEKPDLDLSGFRGLHFFVTISTSYKPAYLHLQNSAAAYRKRKKKTDIR